MIVTPEYVHYAPHAIVTGLLSILGWFFKNLYNDIKEEWSDTKKRLITIETTTCVQAENHLNTIQANTAKTNELLEKISENQAEMNGFLKGRL